MKLLTIDTSTSACSAAITDGERLVGEYLLAGGPALSSRLFDCIDSLLAECRLSLGDMDGFGVALGPGAFTGLRVGLGAVKGMALATGKPIAGFSSLAMLALNVPMADRLVCPLFDARKDEVYAGFYRFGESLRASAPDAVLSPADLPARITEPALFLGDGAVRYRDQIAASLGRLAVFAPSYAHTPRAAHGATLALAMLHRGERISAASLLPAYIRASEAEMARQRRESV